MRLTEAAMAGIDRGAYDLVVRPVRAGRAGLSASGKERPDRLAIVLEDSLSAAMAAAQAGDAEAYRALLRDCVPVIAAAARAKGIRGDTVDDVVQETLLTVHRARASYDPSRPFLPWLRAIAQRRAIDILRRDARRPREAHEPIAYEAHADETIREASHRLEAGERDARLARAVAALPDGQRQAVEELGFRERSLSEASAVTGRSTGALKVNLHRALKALRGALTDARRDGDV